VPRENRCPYAHPPGRPEVLSRRDWWRTLPRPRHEPRPGRDGYGVTVVTTKEGASLPDSQETDGYAIVRLPKAVTVDPNHLPPAVGRFLWRNAGEYDVVHAHSHLHVATNLAAVVRRSGEFGWRTHLDGLPLLWAIMVGDMRRGRAAARYGHGHGMRRRLVATTLVHQTRTDGARPDPRRDRPRTGDEAPVRCRVHSEAVAVVRPEDRNPTDLEGVIRRVGHRESRNIDVVPIVNRSAVGACPMPGSTTPDSGRRSTYVLQYLPISLLCLRKRKSGLETLPRVCALFGTEL